MEPYNKENYRRHLQNNNLIGFVLGLAGIALAIILYVLSIALSK